MRKREVTCAEYTEALRSVGGVEAIDPVSSHTCMDGCYWHHERHIFTGWEFEGRPWSETLRRGTGEDETCEHWLFVYAPPLPGTVENPLPRARLLQWTQ